MGYCTRSDFKSTLAQTLTTASPNPATLDRPAKLADLGRQLNLTSPSGSNVSTYSLADIDYYIRQASSLIDAALRQQYVCPLHPKVGMEMRLLQDIDEYTADSLQITRFDNLNVGDVILFIQNGIEERATISEIESDGTVTIADALMYDYDASITRVMTINFPDPIPYITAKLACAMFYDKWAKAQQEPMKSDYGDILRKEAEAELNNIREGRTILEGVDRQGSRFVNPNLYSRYALDKLIDQDSTRTNQSRG